MIAWFGAVGWGRTRDHQWMSLTVTMYAESP